MSDPNPLKPVGVGVHPPVTAIEVPEVTPGVAEPNKLLNLRDRLRANAAPLPGEQPPVVMGVNMSARPRAEVPAAPSAAEPTLLAGVFTYGNAPTPAADLVNANDPPLFTDLPIPAPTRGPDGEPARVEVEMKFLMPTRKSEGGYVIDDIPGVRHRASKACSNFVQLPRVREADEYFTSPAMEPDTYLRIRRTTLDGEMSNSRKTETNDLTWKGPFIDATSKSRREETVFLKCEDDVSAMRRLLAALGYRRFVTVVKDRESFKLTHAGFEVTMTFDRVERLPNGYVELEIITIEPAVPGAVAILQDLARLLQLGEQERRGYAKLVPPETP